MSSSEYVNELLGSIKCRELCDFMLLPWQKLNLLSPGILRSVDW
jgi:hypothetical protein